ncbi:uncharacterized protein LOC124811942 isoform X2 [Hydra vulgaris]|uniref:Uncharacterized protein LOC124811942 isoform X2 n=1 Tax=Hydra vulgaris TaxID=6087 RepID=A0ABM4BAK8_HYDVU
MFYLKLLLIIIVGLSSGIVYDNFCKDYPSSPQCQLINKNTRPPNERCNPFANECMLNDFVDSSIASCKVYSESGADNPDLRCFPQITAPINVYSQRIIAVSEGDPSCVPVKYKMKLVCGDRGTRCVCDTGDSRLSDPVNKWTQHLCRCQWSIDFCSINNVCTNNSKCISSGSSLLCTDGSVNQCTISPSLCQSINSYCVELIDTPNTQWTIGSGVEGYGFICIEKSLFNSINNLAPYCNLNITNQVIKSDFRIPYDGIDYCCYAYLTCVKKGDKVGGFLLKPRPCYCLTEFKKCLLSIKIVRQKDFALSFFTFLNKIAGCTFDDSGKCNPQTPSTCEKGDLINPKYANCKINCLSGPLLPIEIRSCRIRKCIPPNNFIGMRILDVPNPFESSRCDSVKDLPIECGFSGTRCVCDGQPSGDVFTDGCRCQYWPV